MKNNDIQEVIKRKDEKNLPHKKRTYNVRNKLVVFSLICFIFAVIFEVALLKDFTYIRYFLGNSRQYEEMEDSAQNENGKISIDIDKVIYRQERGRIRINSANIIKYAISFVLAIIAYVALFYKLTEKFARNIKDIDNALLNMARGDYLIHVDEEGNDEFAKMAGNLNMLSTKFDEILWEERRTEQTKNELITSIAHDLRTPITSIIGYLELIITRKPDSQTKDKYIEISYAKSKRLERLMEDLFTYTKFSLGQYSTNFTRINLGKLLEQMVEEFYPQFVDADLNYDYVCNSDKDLMLEGDGELIARLFANLFSNSIKYGRDGKSINIEAHLEKDMAVVNVTNYGQVIPKEDLDKIFDKFFRLENSRSRKTGGTGLGLAIVKQIVDIHNGNISVSSTTSGTVFKVELPVARSVD